MAVPTDPTAVLMATEAYNMAGITSPTTAQTTRATTYWLQEILNDIWNASVVTGNTRLKTLQETLIDVTVEGKNFIDLAEAFDEELVVTILKGTHYDTATAGAATSITLAADEDMTEAQAVGRYILLTGGTGEDGYRQITAYNTTTMVATVDSAWATNPSTDTTYRVIDNVVELEEVDIGEIDTQQPPVAGVPTAFAKYGRKIYFDRPFDASTYGIMIRYFQNIHEVDITGTLFTRILQNWRDVLQQGLLVKTLKDLDDTRYVAETQLYESKKSALLVKEIAYGGEFTGFTL